MAKHLSFMRITVLFKKARHKPIRKVVSLILDLRAFDFDLRFIPSSNIYQNSNHISYSSSTDFCTVVKLPFSIQIVVCVWSSLIYYRIIRHTNRVITWWSSSSFASSALIVSLLFIHMTYSSYLITYTNHYLLVPTYLFILIQKTEKKGSWQLKRCRVLSSTVNINRK